MAKLGFMLSILVIAVACGATPVDEPLISSTSKLTSIPDGWIENTAFRDGLREMHRAWNAPYLIEFLYVKPYSDNPTAFIWVERPKNATPGEEQPEARAYREVEIPISFSTREVFPIRGRYHLFLNPRRYLEPGIPWIVQCAVRMGEYIGAPAFGTPPELEDCRHFMETTELVPR